MTTVQVNLQVVPRRNIKPHFKHILKQCSVTGTRCHRNNGAEGHKNAPIPSLRMIHCWATQGTNVEKKAFTSLIIESDTAVQNRALKLLASTRVLLCKSQA